MPYLWHVGQHRQAPGQKPLLWFLWEELSEAGKEDHGLPSLNNFNRLWGIETTPHCLVLGPGVIRRGGCIVVQTGTAP